MKSFLQIFTVEGIVTVLGWFCGGFFMFFVCVVCVLLWFYKHFFFFLTISRRENVPYGATGKPMELGESSIK